MLAGVSGIGCAKTCQSLKYVAPLNPSPYSDLLTPIDQRGGVPFTTKEDLIYDLADRNMFLIDWVLRYQDLDIWR